LKVSTAWPGQLVSSHVTSRRATARVRPAPGTGVASVSFPVQCPGGHGQVSVSSVFTGKPGPHAKIVVTKRDF